MTVTQTLIEDPAAVAPALAGLRLEPEQADSQTDSSATAAAPPGPLYPAYLPSTNVEETKETFPAWEVEDYIDPGSRGTADFRNLLRLPGVQSFEVTPALGTEIKGVQLSTLSTEGLDDLALLAAHRGVLIFRDQDFKDIGFDRQRDVVRHFGRLHVHPTMPHPEGVPEMHVVYRDPSQSSGNFYKKAEQLDKISSVVWHVDHTAELQPPGITFFMALEVPPTGGDTLFVSQTEAYNRLSDEFKKRLEGLYTFNSNKHQIDHSKANGGAARFEPLHGTLHPLTDLLPRLALHLSRRPLHRRCPAHPARLPVRTHPVTGQKSLSIHTSHARHIHGLKQEESDNLYDFLNGILHKGGDFQARCRYEPGTVAVWDNRVVAHTGTVDFRGDERRHMIRLGVLAETPF